MSNFGYCSTCKCYGRPVSVGYKTCDKCREYQREYSKINAEKKRQAAKVWYKNNTEYASEQRKEYYKAHHIKGRGEDQAEKRMRRILNQPNLTQAAFKLLA